jgi:hypothetical protein
VDAAVPAINEGEERGDRKNTHIGATLVVAFISAPDRRIAVESWRRRLSDRDNSPPPHDSALFAVLDGEGDCVLLEEFAAEAVDADANAETSIRRHFGNGGLLSCTVFERIFAAGDARPLSAASRFVFLAQASVDPALDHSQFNEWYDTTHVPDVDAAGLSRAQRFRAKSADEEYLASYEIASPAVLTSPQLQRVRGFHQFTPSIRRLQRTVGELIAGPHE